MLNVITTKAELEVLLNKIPKNDETAINQSDSSTLENTIDTKEIQVLKKKIVKTLTPTSEVEKNNILIDPITSKTQIKQKEKLKTSSPKLSIKKENNILVTQQIDGIENGFYLIAGVFSNKKNVNNFIEKLENKDLVPQYFYNTKKKLYYIYLKKYSDLTAIETARKTKLDGHYFDDLWTLSVEN